MGYKVEVRGGAAKFFKTRRVGYEHKDRVRNALHELAEEPRRGDRHLKGEYYCFWRRRVSDYKIIYRVFEEEKRVVVVEICLICLRSQCY